MRLRTRLVFFAMILSVTGCATSAHRDSAPTLSSRSAAWSHVTAPRQTQVSLPAEQPDLFFTGEAEADRSRLSKYFPGLSRKHAASPTPRAVVQASPKADPTLAVSATKTDSARPTLFGLLKPRTPQMYTTDARTSAPKSNVEPSYLPVALQVPSAGQADQAVRPTSVNLPDATADLAEAKAKDNSVSPNPDASSASATPLSTTEPRLAVDPAGFQKSEAADQPDTTPAAKAPSPTDPTPSGPAEESTPDPGERPRLSANPAESSPATDNMPDAPQAATGPARSSDDDQPNSDDATVKATPTAADPTNSLGLPPVTLPASYSSHDPGLIQGSGQATQPAPVLASPQVAASPQSAGTHAPGVIHPWHRPSLRRLVRRMASLGEFASPPTSPPR